MERKELEHNFSKLYDRFERTFENLYELRKKILVGAVAFSVLLGGDLTIDGMHLLNNNKEQYITISTSHGEFLLKESNGQLYKYVPNGKIGSWVETPFITQEQELELEKKLKLEKGQGQEQASEPHAGESHPHTHEENATARVAQ
ncbi:MAG: hypothetical protein AB1921_14320 [Thermodesulfobacteriota bacterium]